MKLQDFSSNLGKKLAIFYFREEQYILEITAAISLMTLAMHETCIRREE